MLLALDIGNTETTVGQFDAQAPDRVAARWRLTTHAPRTADELALTLRHLVEGAVDGVVIGSVVPPLTRRFADACATAFGVVPVVVDALSPLPITLDVDEPALVGADRIVNTLAAHRIYARDLLVVDLGTATTYDCITADGVFLGGVIQPGVLSAGEALLQRAAHLPATPLAAPERTIGKNTAEAIRAGVVFGAAEGIDGMIRRIKGEWPGGGVPFVVATGGLASAFRGLCREFDDVDPDLTLKGLRLAYSIVSG